MGVAPKERGPLRDHYRGLQCIIQIRTNRQVAKPGLKSCSANSVGAPFWWASKQWGGSKHNQPGPQALRVLLVLGAELAV